MLIRVLNVKVSDTSKVDSSSKASYIIIYANLSTRCKKEVSST